MAQLERSGRHTESPQTPRTSPISGHLLMAEQKAHASPTRGMFQDEEADFNSSSGKKSVISKVKEGALKLKHSLSGKKKHENELTSPTPSPSPTLSAARAGTGSALQNDSNADRELDGDPEYLGAPMYESEAAPEALKENARQHPRAQPVLPESHKFPSTTNSDAANEGKSATEAASEAIQETRSKIASLAVSGPGSKKETNFPAHTQNAAKGIGSSPAHITAVPENTEDSNQYEASSLKTEDKGVLGKEQFMNKMQPREDESEISQKKSTGDSSVVDKVKGAVYSMLDMGHQKPTKSTTKATESSSAILAPENIPSPAQQTRDAINANTAKDQEVIEEQNHGKILQAN